MRRLFVFIVFCTLPVSIFKVDAKPIQQNNTGQINRKQHKKPVNFNFQEGFADIIENVIPSVVNISVKQNSKDNKNLRESLGSGFIFDKKGYIVTNNHVIEDADDINVILHDNSELKAEIIGRDAKYDIAVLKIKIPETKKLKEIKWGNSDKIRVGNWALAIGNPEGFGNTVTHGIISCISRDLSSRIRDIGGNDLVDYIQTDASINTGNSGGPLFNIKGEVIGIVTVIVSETGSNSGLNFAMPSNSIKEAIEQLKNFGKMKRSWIGVQLDELDPDVAESLNIRNANSSVVERVIPNSPAEKSGIKQGDIIVAVNNKKTIQNKTIARMISELHVGQTVTLTIIRNGIETNINVQVGFNPDEDDGEISTYTITNNSDSNLIKPLGIYVETLSEKLNTLLLDLPKDVKGVMVVKICKGSSIEEVDIRTRDIILSINNTEISTKEDFMQTIEQEQKTGKKKVALKILRDGKLMYRSVNLLQN